MNNDEKAGSPQVLVTGRHWLGADGARSIGSVIVDMISSAHQEIIIVAYRLTFSVAEFVQALERALGRGCLVRIVRNCDDHPVPVEEEYIKRLMTQYDTLSVWDFKENNSAQQGFALHAKMVIVDRGHAVVGSANFSKNGMIENHEVAVELFGMVVKSLGVVCDRLLENGQREGVLIKRTANEP